jgi:hypothetical protein
MVGCWSLIFNPVDVLLSFCSFLPSCHPIPVVGMRLQTLELLIE